MKLKTDILLLATVILLRTVVQATAEYERYKYILNEYISNDLYAIEYYLHFIDNVISHEDVSIEVSPGDAARCTPGGNYSLSAVFAGGSLPPEQQPSSPPPLSPGVTAPPEQPQSPSAAECEAVDCPPVNPGIYDDLLFTIPDAQCHGVTEVDGVFSLTLGQGSASCSPIMFNPQHKHTIVTHWDPADTEDPNRQSLMCISIEGTGCVEIFVEDKAFHINNVGNDSRFLAFQTHSVALSEDASYFTVSFWFIDGTDDSSSHIGVLANGAELGYVYLDDFRLSQVRLSLPLPSPGQQMRVPFIGRLFDCRDYRIILPNRWIFETLHNGGSALDIPAASCYCPSGAPRIVELDECSDVEYEATDTRKRTDRDIHPVEYMRKSVPGGYWLSQLDTEHVNITIKLPEPLAVFGMRIPFREGQPTAMRIYLVVQGVVQPVLSIARDCERDFGMPHEDHVATISDDDLDSWTINGYLPIPNGTDPQDFEHVCTDWTSHTLGERFASSTVSAIWLTVRQIVSHMASEIVDDGQFVAEQVILELRGNSLGYTHYGIGTMQMIGKCACRRNGGLCTTPSYPWTAENTAEARFYNFAMSNANYQCFDVNPPPATSSSRAPPPGSTDEFTSSTSSDEETTPAAIGPNPPPRASTLSEGAIIGIGVGAAVLTLGVVVAIIVFCIRRGRRSVDGGETKKEKKLRLMSSGSTRYVAGPTAFAMQMKSLDEDTTFKVKKCLIPRENLRLGAFLGKGNFGTVHSGQLNQDGTWIKVAVKTIKDDHGIDSTQAFLVEATIMMDFKHENVLGLLGVTYDDHKPLVVLPFMEFGDLRSLLKSEKKTFEMGDYIHFCMQISHGMDYLSREKFVHRDLATRNCMVDESYMVKIADFGLTQDIYERDYYRAQDHSKPLPVKWMAPESLTEGRFSSQTDVWSFGVVMWEIFTDGATPYPGVSNFDMKAYVSEGQKLDKPSKCPNGIYGLMQACWAMTGDDRPSFRHLSMQLVIESKNYTDERLYTKNISDEYYLVSQPSPKPTEKDYLQLM